MINTKGFEYTAVILITLFIGLYALSISSVQVAEGEVGSRDCVVSTSTTKIVGASVSKLILATSSKRAWAEISIKDNATSSIYLSIKNGSAAVVGEGLGLNIGFGAGVSTTPSIAFGRNTDLPYTGAVTGKTNIGSTTVRVTQCNY